MDMNMSMDAFLKQNVKQPENERLAVSERITDAEGKAIEWEIKSLSNQQDDELRKKHTKTTKQRNGAYIPTLDTTAYLKDLAVNSVVFPNLHDKLTQESWQVMDAGGLIDCLLKPGEYNELLKEVQKVNGWDVDIKEVVEEVKNE